MNAWRFLAAIVFISVCGLAQTRYSVADEPAAGPGSPRVVVLRDQAAGVEAAVTPSEGGELSSYRVKFQGQWIELLYHARDYSPGPGFKGKAPLLWPAVGAQYPVGTIPETSCGEGTYAVAGKSYPMPCHGFARSLPWNEVKRSADNSGARVTVQLRDSARTRPLYPFAFQLDASYTLSGGHLTIDYTVASDRSNAEPMKFSIGNHIAFNIPFVKGSNPAEMTFETPSTVQLLRNSRGVLSGEQRPRSFDTPTRLGDFDALVAMPLAGYRSQPYVRLVDPQGVSLRVTQQASSTVAEPLVRFNIFGGPKTGYFSPEPWFGIQNSLNLGRGVVQLAPGESWKWRIELQADGPAPAVPPGSSGIEKIAGDFGFVEGPVWSKQGFLIFSDIYNSRIMKSTGANHAGIYRNYSNAANGNSMDVQGRLYTAERDGRRVVRMERDGSLSVIAAEWKGKRLNSPNDVTVRRDGQVYFSDPASKAVLEPQELGFNGVYHVTPSGKLSLITEKLARPNGVALTPDGRTLYVADSEAKKIFAYDLDGDGNASRERVFISGIDGSPDGLRVAANGNLYIACRGICVYTPAGKFIRTIEFPESPANCAFGDADLRTLYVTARTSIYRIRIPDTGSLQY
ncbi:MAG TPA: SMP-30/gluconolactonase/LRE family protein [Bryobacteraceae bacterium]|nr:SMP-30/gluconolactonase/LRE family protein [Bryobacteraceae bacterium]